MKTFIGDFKDKNYIKIKEFCKHCKTPFYNTKRLKNRKKSKISS